MVIENLPITPVYGQRNIEEAHTHQWLQVRNDGYETVILWVFGKSVNFHPPLPNTTESEYLTDVGAVCSGVEPGGWSVLAITLVGDASSRS